MSDDIARLKSALAYRYSIERQVGCGGMAVVYVAEDVKHHRKVAVKVLRPELAASLGTERFVREIETTAKLTHPNIPPLLDSGSVEEQPTAVPPYRRTAMLNVALTGNAAAGKSTVARWFADWGATVIDSDALVAEAQQPG